MERKIPKTDAYETKWEFVKRSTVDDASEFWSRYIRNVEMSTANDVTELDEYDKRCPM